MSEANPSPAATTRADERQPALDWLRGIVMALMTVDHCGEVFDRGHFARDAAGEGLPRELPAAEFLTRWCSHLCAPTFVFLAGAGAALSIANAQRRGVRARSIDGHLLLRGLVLIALEVLLISKYWRWQFGGDTWALRPIHLQVIWALGFGTLLLVPLRRLGDRWLALLAGALLVAVELANPHRGFLAPWWQAMFVTGGGVRFADRGWAPDLFVLYPALPWLPALLLGLVFGRRLARGAPVLRTLLLGGGALLSLFALLRGLRGFGNMGLQRRSGALLEWLHCSKYPPSITYLAMELGVMALLLAALVAWQRRGRPVLRSNPLLVLGQVPLFYYLLHLPLIALWDAVGLFEPSRLTRWTWLAALVTVLAGWPLCAAYRFYKQRWRHAWTRYL